MKDKAEKKSRLTVDVPQQLKDKIDDIAQKTGASTGAEVLRHALQLYSLVSEHTKGGGKFIFRHPNGSEESVILI